MALTPHPVIAELKTHAQRSGLFGSVLTHEPLSAPAVSDAVTYGMWVRSYTPVQSSGAASVSMRLVITGQIYMSALAKPADNIDGNILAVAMQLYDTYCGNFTLGGLVRQVDIFGQHGIPLGVEFGYATMDSKVFRLATITIPLLINDAHEEVA